MLVFFFFASYQEHYITICLLTFLKKLLLDHLSMVYEAYELPLAQVDDFLRYIERHVNDCDFLVLRIERLVGKKWVIDDPGLRYGLLRIMQQFLYLFCVFFVVFILFCHFFDDTSDEV